MQYRNYDNERRKQRRTKVEFILTYKVNQPMDIKMLVGNQEVNALMLDLSQQGMAIMTDYDIPVSTLLLIKFTLINLKADGENRISSISLTGLVKNNTFQKIRHHRLGIAFQKIPEEDISAIVDFIKQSRIA